MPWARIRVFVVSFLCEVVFWFRVLMYRVWHDTLAESRADNPCLSLVSVLVFFSALCFRFDVLTFSEYLSICTSVDRAVDRAVDRTVDRWADTQIPEKKNSRVLFVQAIGRPTGRLTWCTSVDRPVDRCVLPGISGCFIDRSVGGFDLDFHVFPCFLLAAPLHLRVEMDFICFGGCGLELGFGVCLL